MELIGRIGGFGKIKVDTKEHQMLQELQNIISTSGKSYILGKDNQPTKKFEQLMETLFPAFSLAKGAGLQGMKFSNRYMTAWSDSHHYQDLPQALELVIGSRLPIPLNRKRI